MDNLKRYAVLAMIVGGIMFALSGLCTGLFIASGPDDYVPNRLGVLGIGMIGMVPSAVLFLSARNIFKTGPKILPAIFILIISLPLFAWIMIGLAGLIRQAVTYQFGPPIGILVFLALAALFAAVMTVFAVKTIRTARNKTSEADEF